MRKVLTLACLLAVAHHVAATCSSIPTYTETFIPQCAPNDIYVKWPNYEDQSTYYKCNGVNNPVEVACPDNEYFCFVLQQCVFCADYLPPVQCSQLKTQYTPNCVPIGQGGSTGSPSGSTFATPNYPNDTTTATTTTKTTTTKTTTLATTKTTTAAPITVPTPPTSAPGTTGTTSDIPAPPSPVTNDPGIPMPPTPDPTPPSVDVSPPTIPSPPTAG